MIKAMNQQKRDRAADASVDKYYTTQKTAEYCAIIVFKYFPHICTVVEPSAGKNTFAYAIKKVKKGAKVFSFDLLPDARSIKKEDYLKLDTQRAVKKKIDAFIGNPPFGLKASLAVKFLNKALAESDIVAFIMPITAEKYSVQRQINPNAKLAYTERLPEAFELPDGKPYGIKCVFQVWTTREATVNKRAKAPRIKHADFELYRHNATVGSRKYIDMSWDFAVYAQGRKDYGKIFLTNEKEYIRERILNSSDQFYFFKAKNKTVLNRLKKINFVALARNGSITPGFCKNDIIAEYRSLYEVTSTPSSNPQHSSSCCRT
ncbi:MAG: hypothetical protein LBC85_02095 [Fibromonadaceae bacterium]|nr:hypothetical protein [Fibromonadaceae bacterium]